MVVFDLSQSREKLTSHSGLALIGRALEQTSINMFVDSLTTPNQKGEVTISHSNVLISYMGLLSQGKSNYEAISDFRDDDFFKLSLDIQRVPASSTLRLRLDELALVTGEGDLKIRLKKESALLLKKRQVKLTPTLNKLVALDLDVSPFDNSGSKKEEVSRTYKGFDGYSPMFAYLGEEGYQINAELRPGRQHCQNGTPDFLRETLYLVRLVTDAILLVRMDSGNDSKDNLFILEEAEDVYYIIKRNLRRENLKEWLEKAKKIGIKEDVRYGKTIYRGQEKRKKTQKVDGEKKEIEVNCVFQVTFRTHDHEGKLLEKEIIEVESYWTSLTPEIIGKKPTTNESSHDSRQMQPHEALGRPEIVEKKPQANESSHNESQIQPDEALGRPETVVKKKELNESSHNEAKILSSTSKNNSEFVPKVDTKIDKTNELVIEVIEQYHSHGTSEQFHSEEKTDMNLERLPSGYFATNHLVLILGLLVYNILRIIGQIGNRCPDIPLRKSATRRRLSTVIQNLIYIAARLVRHARRFKLSFGFHCPWFRTFKYIYHQLAPI